MCYTWDKGGTGDLYVPPFFIYQGRRKQSADREVQIDVGVARAKRAANFGPIAIFSS